MSEDVVFPLVTALKGRTARRESTGELLGEIRDIGALAGLSTLRFHHEVLSPGRRCSPEHWHSHREEALYVLTGSVTVTIGHQVSEVGAGGAVCFTPGGPAHSVKNTSELPATVLVASATGADDQVTFEGA